MEIAQFRVYPNSSKRNGLFFTVSVFDTQKAMLAHCHENGGACECDVEGACHCFDEVDMRADGLRMTKHIGDIHLHAGALGCGVVAHEMLHATFGWLRRVTRNDEAKIADMEDEERFAWVLGNLVAQTTVQLYKAGVY